MAPPFSVIPTTARHQPTPFELHVEEQKLKDFKTLLKLSPVGKDAYENQEERKGKFGVSKKWMLDAKRVWEEDFDWLVLFL